VDYGGTETIVDTSVEHNEANGDIYVDCALEQSRRRACRTGLFRSYDSKLSVRS
jgi:hypothetical protein